jgi:MFS family permease
MSVTHDALRQVPLKLRLVEMCTAALFVVPVIVMFFSLRGVDMALFLLTQAFFRAGVIVLEVPTGYLADAWSRRNTLLVGTVFYLAGLGTMLVAYGFWMMVAAELLMAVGCVMFSGTVSAILYDTLTTLGERHRAREEMGKLRQWEQMAVGVSMLGGGVLYQVSPELPVILTIVCFALALGVLATLPEPPRKTRVAENHLKDLFTVVRYALHGHPELKWLMVYPAVLLGMTVVPFWATQQLMADAGMGTQLFGLLLMLYFVFNGFVSRHAAAIERKVGLRRLTWLLLVFVLAGFAVLALVPGQAAFIGLVLCGSGWSLGSVLFVDLVNRLIDDHAADGDASDIRATVLSVFTLMQQIYGMAGLVLAGFLTPMLGLPSVLALLGLGVAVVAVVPLMKVLQMQSFAKR